MQKITALYRQAKHNINKDPDMEAFWLTALIIVVAVRLFV